MALTWILLRSRRESGEFYSPAECVPVDPHRASKDDIFEAYTADPLSHDFSTTLAVLEEWWWTLPPEFPLLLLLLFVLLMVRRRF
jgi:hypothetical protein